MECRIQVLLVYGTRLHGDEQDRKGEINHVPTIVHKAVAYLENTGFLTPNTGQPVNAQKSPC